MESFHHTQCRKRSNTSRLCVKRHKKRRWNYLGHVLRSDEKRLNQHVLMWTHGGKKENAENLLKPLYEKQYPFDYKIQNPSLKSAMIEEDI